ncbi:hypothetical protein [Nonomuraea sp. NPDC049158]|uniref:hypothetical protein n=1 Tax=Nonomuraea sp. NPDC049158 TaxID=3155649 RepID=UPI003409977A
MGVVSWERCRLGEFYVVIPHRTMPVWSVMVPWGIVLAIDLVVSFSYTLVPRGQRTTR